MIGISGIGMLKLYQIMREVAHKYLNWHSWQNSLLSIFLCNSYCSIKSQTILPKQTHVYVVMYSLRTLRGRVPSVWWLFSRPVLSSSLWALQLQSSSDSVHGIFGTGILEWVAISTLTRGLLDPGTGPTSPASKADSFPLNLWDWSKIHYEHAAGLHVYPGADITNG